MDEQRVTDREFQTTQLQEKLNNVDNAIATLAVIKSPYAGTVRRVKWLGQRSLFRLGIVLR